MKKTKFSKRGALIGFITSLILLTLIYITYYTTTTTTLQETTIKPVTQFFIYLYSWFYILFVYIFSIIGIELNSPFLYFVFSSGIYTVLGGFLLSEKKHKKRK